MSSPVSEPPLGSKLWHPNKDSPTAVPKPAGHATCRKAGASYEETLLPAAMTFELPAAEKYGTPAALAAFAALATGPSWKNGSSRYDTSSTSTEE